MAALDLAGKLAIVSGASRGIGAAIAEALAARGADLALVARGADLAVVARRLGPGRILPFTCDLREPEQIEALVADVLRAFGRIDILVNNAGATPHGNLLEGGDEEWMDAYAAKLHAYVRLSRACWPHLRATRGRVVNIGGVLAKNPNPEALIGSTLAAAVVSLTKALAEFGRADGIVVNGVNPGLIDTGRLARNIDALAQAKGLSHDAARSQLLERVGVARLGTPQDVAAAVDFLLSDRAAYLRGAMIDVDGGLTKGL